MSLLSITGLNLSIHGTSILKDVSLDVAEGEIVGIIGESGSGKSMTALSVLQLLPNGAHCEGRIELGGEDVITADEDTLCALRGDDVSMIFQEPMTALNPLKTIGDQVAETVQIHTGASRAVAMGMAAEALERAELPQADFPLSRYPFELSGGQRQRVCIATAIALRPRLLIADEPTTALDVTTQAEILDLLRRLVAEDGMGLIFITHDLAVVSGLADRIAVMRHGEIVERDTAEGLFREMEHPYTRQLHEASTHVPTRPERGEIGETLLSVKGMVRDYKLPRKNLFAPPGHFRAVDDVSFELRRGENLGLIGESGCGKSTLSRAILGLDPIQGGEILLDGEPVTAGKDLSPKVRAKMQVVFQDPYASFNPRHRVERLVAEPTHLMPNRPSSAQKRRMVGEMLEKVGLTTSDAQKYIHEFSGGQRQRIAIARALIINPDLIVLDEAVSALDVSIRAQILDLLAELSDTLSLSYLFISHDLSVVRTITDRVLIMKGGHIVEEGETEQVFSNPRHPYTKALIEAAPLLDAPPKVIAF
jgi:peptide/nickel transport system ATP-binding protein